MATIEELKKTKSRLEKELEEVNRLIKSNERLNKIKSLNEKILDLDENSDEYTQVLLEIKKMQENDFSKEYVAILVLSKKIDGFDYAFCQDEEWRCLEKWIKEQDEKEFILTSKMTLINKKCIDAIIVTTKEEATKTTMYKAYFKRSK